MLLKQHIQFFTIKCSAAFVKYLALSLGVRGGCSRWFSLKQPALNTAYLFLLKSWQIHAALQRCTWSRALPKFYLQTGQNQCRSHISSEGDSTIANFYLLLPEWWEM